MGVVSEAGVVPHGVVVPDDGAACVGVPAVVTGLPGQAGAEAEHELDDNWPITAQYPGHVKVYSIMTLFHYTLVYYFPFFQNDREGKYIFRVEVNKIYHSKDLFILISKV